MNSVPEDLCTQNGSKCFKFISDKKNWSDAKSHCESIGYNLAIIENEEERRLASTFSVYGFLWIGIQRNSNGEFIYSNGEKAQYLYWRNGQPTGTYNGEATDCVDIWENSNEYSDWYCTNEYAFVCSKGILK